MMSATLTPFEHHRDLLGLPESTRWFECPSPYAGQLKVHVHPGVSSRYADRAASLERIAGIVADTLATKPGRYLFFASSYAYLNDLRAALDRYAPQIVHWAEAPAASGELREHFVAQLTAHTDGVGFAVLGGAFNEGIDLAGLAGLSLAGAFVATLGLPPASARNEVLRSRLHARGMDGWRTVYLIPGLTRVAQAGGRIVRGPDDRGTLHLLDDRYMRPETRALLPAWWFGRGG
jgi:Rad3-related DNA helicase